MNLGNALGALARTSFDAAPIIDAEEYVEKVTATAIGTTFPLSHGPVVQGSVELYRSSDNFLYTLGIDYLEDPDGGIENMRIPVGTVVRAEYNYHGEPPIGEGGGVFVANPASEVQAAAGTDPQAVSIRYATMMKQGAI